MSAGSEPSPSGVRRSIGEVVSLLRPEFSDLTDSKIRFLEDRKLISPSRTPGGYRSFGPHDIEVLRWILTRQRDQYLPLSVIGERIDRGEHLADIWGIGMHEVAEVVEPAVPAPEMYDDHRPYTAAELSAESGLSADEIAELAGFGLLVPLDDADAAGSPSPGSEAVQASLELEPPEALYGSGALLIARISREFATYGLAARHLRVIRNAAARDASMFEQGIQPILHVGGASADADVQRSLGRLVALCERLRAQVMGDALRRYWP